MLLYKKNYGFNDKLSTTNIKELQQKIKTKGKNKDTLMAKEGYMQTMVWMKLAGQREEGEETKKSSRRNSLSKEGCGRMYN